GEEIHMLKMPHVEHKDPKVGAYIQEVRSTLHELRSLERHNAEQRHPNQAYVEMKELSDVEAAQVMRDLKAQGATESGGSLPKAHYNTLHTVPHAVKDAVGAQNGHEVGTYNTLNNTLKTVPTAIRSEKDSK